MLSLALVGFYGAVVQLKQLIKQKDVAVNIDLINVKDDKVK